MNYKLINEQLSDIDALRSNQKKRISKEIIYEVNGENGEQGQEGLAYEFFDIGLEDGVVLKMTITTDSYGDNETVSGIEFVKPIKKEVTVFETI